MRFPLLTRFYSNVRKTKGCWVWEGHRNQDGYGLFGIGGGRNKFQHRAHRWIWLNKKGYIPKGYVVRHKCKNKACVRLSHLMLGTITDNIRDESKLTQVQIRRIRGFYRRGCTKLRDQLMENFPLKRRQLNRILKGDSWS